MVLLIIYDIYQLGLFYKEDIVQVMGTMQYAVNGSEQQTSKSGGNNESNQKKQTQQNQSNSNKNKYKNKKGNKNKNKKQQPKQQSNDNNNSKTEELKENENNNNNSNALNMIESLEKDFAKLNENIPKIIYYECNNESNIKYKNSLNGIGKYCSQLLRICDRCNKSIEMGDVKPRGFNTKVTKHMILSQAPRHSRVPNLNEMYLAWKNLIKSIRFICNQIVQLKTLDQFLDFLTDFSRI